jgi:hypothetical protein
VGGAEKAEEGRRRVHGKGGRRRVERRRCGEAWANNGAEKAGEEVWAKKGGTKKRGRRHKSREAGESVETLGEATGRRGF